MNTTYAAYVRAVMKVTDVAIAIHLTSFVLIVVLFSFGLALIDFVTGIKVFTVFFGFGGDGSTGFFATGTGVRTAFVCVGEVSPTPRFNLITASTLAAAAAAAAAKYALDMFFSKIFLEFFRKTTVDVYDFFFSWC